MDNARENSAFFFGDAHMQVYKLQLNHQQAIATSGQVYDEEEVVESATYKVMSHSATYEDKYADTQMRSSGRTGRTIASIRTEERGGLLG